MRWIYSFVYTTAFLIALPYFLILGLIRGKYLGNFMQRFGFLSSLEAPNVCWVHAVSVGEYLAAKPFIQRLQQEFSDMKIVVSTTTVTGQRLAQTHFPGSTFYFPFDWAWSVRKAFRRIKPRLIVILETEIWPNFLWEAERRKIPVILANGRVSDRSFRGYFPFRKFLPRFSRSLMQSSEDAERISGLGGKNVSVMGNMKFDLQTPAASESLRSTILGWKQESLLWISGSTMKGEEEILLKVYGRLKNDFPVKLLIAPRHPERFSEVLDLTRKAGHFHALRTAVDRGSAEVMILDTIGELASSYEFADIVFIGGTLLPSGAGHNPIEPALYQKPIVTGTHYSNFRAIFEEFKKRHAILITDNLEPAIRKLLEDPELRRKMGVQAGKLVNENAGATEIAVESVREFWNAGKNLEPDSKLLVR